LAKFLLPVLEKLNPGLPKSAYEDVLIKISQKEADKTFNRTNKEKYELIRSGITVSFLDEKNR
jgi:type I restriction enzyme R subunit